MRSILCLDLGTKTGWAWRDHTGLVLSGHENFTPKRFEGGGMRFVRFKCFLNDIILRSSVDQIYFEEVRNHRGVDAAHVYGGFMATMQACCEHCDAIGPLPYSGVPVGTIKKCATGTGNASKAKVIDAVNRLALVPRVVSDDNEADALALLHWAINNTEEHA